MLKYAVKLTRDPGGMTAGDVGALRAAGFGDRAILDICQIVAYYNYANRLADGLGVELETTWRDRELTLPRREFDAMRDAGPRAGTQAGAAAESGPGEPQLTRERP